MELIAGLRLLHLNIGSVLKLELVHHSASFRSGAHQIGSRPRSIANEAARWVAASISQPYGLTSVFRARSIGGATFAKSQKVNMFYKGKTMECLARTIEHDETDAVPRLAEYVRHSHADKIGITAETTEETFNELVTAAAKTYPIVTIRPRLSVSGS